MINVEELRIGNYVMYNGIVVRVYGIIPPAPNADDYWNDVWILELFEGASTITARLEDISAIELDNEWCALFLKEDYTQENGSYIDICLTEVFLGGMDSCVNGHGFLLEDVKYVHRLQNIVYSLTSKNITL
jgi:hypothetical protein